MDLRAAGDAALIGTIYDPPRARSVWAIRDALPDGVARYYSLARWALVDALRAGGVVAGDCVMLPALICRDVLAAVHTVGATAAFYEVTSRLEAANLEPGAGVKAIVAVNYFGFPQDLRPFRELCDRTGAALIEDNAHGLFSRDEGGRWLGGRGDAGVFSFRKTIAVPDGAALVLGHGATPPVSLRPVSSPQLRYRAKQAARRVVGHVDPVRTIGTIKMVRRLRQAVTGNAVAAGAPDPEMKIPGAANPPVLDGLLHVADPQLEAERRRALYLVVRKLLESSGIHAVFPDLPELVVPYGFPFLVSDSELCAVSRRLSHHGLPLLRWPDLPTAVAGTAPDHYRQLIVVPFLW